VEVSVGVPKDDAENFKAMMVEAMLENRKETSEGQGRSVIKESRYVILEELGNILEKNGHGTVLITFFNCKTIITELDVHHPNPVPPQLDHSWIRKAMDLAATAKTDQLGTFDVAFTLQSKASETLLLLCAAEPTFDGIQRGARVDPHPVFGPLGKNTHGGFRAYPNWPSIQSVTCYMSGIVHFIKSVTNGTELKTKSRKERQLRSHLAAMVKVKEALQKLSRNERKRIMKVRIEVTFNLKTLDIQAFNMIKKMARNPYDYLPLITGFNITTIHVPFEQYLSYLKKSFTVLCPATGRDQDKVPYAKQRAEALMANIIGISSSDIRKHINASVKWPEVEADEGKEKKKDLSQKIAQELLLQERTALEDNTSKNDVKIICQNVAWRTHPRNKAKITWTVAKTGAPGDLQGEGREGQIGGAKRLLQLQNEGKFSHWSTYVRLVDVPKWY
jgi:hypothetical protein